MHCVSRNQVQSAGIPGANLSTAGELVRQGRLIELGGAGGEPDLQDQAGLRPDEVWPRRRPEGRRERCGRVQGGP